MGLGLTSRLRLEEHASLARLLALLHRLLAIDPDGSVVMKWPWWWSGVNGQIKITGQRLDRDAPPLTAYTQEGYMRFQPSGIRFPTEGCWEVTGTVGDASLTFVTLVLKAARYGPLKGG